MQSKEAVSVEDGSYKGLWGGWVVSIPSKNIKFDVTAGVRGFDIPVTVLVKNGIAYIDENNKQKDEPQLEQQKAKEVILPNKRVHKTPRLLVADAYTIGSNKFESEEAKEESIYYITFRKKLSKINKTIYSESDDRIIFTGLPRILEKLFYEPVTHSEIDEAIEFLKYAKATTTGFKNYDFPEEIWRRVVDEFNGRPPIHIKALREGSVVYPNEPAIQISSQVKGMGVLAAWFESKLLHVWGPTERLTQSEHVILRLKEKIKIVDPEMSEEMLDFYASLMITDFGDRAGIVYEESEELGMVHLYSFPGTDNFSGAYQAWMNNDKTNDGIFSSVNALAHRNVQSYVNENDCYKAIYESCDDNEIVSMVDDCYDAKRAVHEYLLPLALKSKRLGTGKVVVARPDSSKLGYSILDQVLEIIDLAIKNDLYSDMTTSSGTWKCGTLFRFLDGDGQTFEDLFRIIDVLIEHKYAFYTWGLFGMGGNLRNGLKRDNTSAKYALTSVGAEKRGVVKFSESVGKGTLPGPFKLLRSEKALRESKTIVLESEEGEDFLVEYFNGFRKERPFGEAQDVDSFIDVKRRIKRQLATMPLSLETADNNNYPVSDEVFAVGHELTKFYKGEAK